VSQWGWSPERTQGIWRHGAPWLRPIVAALPYLTIGLALLMMHVVGGTLTVSRGVLFDLPEGRLEEGDATGLVAVVMPVVHDTVVFFDDTRYVLGDPVSMRALGENLSVLASRSGRKTLLVLADRRVSAGNLMALSETVKKSGVKRLLFAEKRTGGGD